MKKREEKMDKKMKKILDDGQYAKWQDMMKERRERQKRELDFSGSVGNWASQKKPDFIAA